MIKKAILSVMLVLWALPLWAAAVEYQVADIVVSGNRRVKADSILNAISIHKGQTVTPAQIDESIQAIYKLGRFSDVAAQIVEVAGERLLLSPGARELLARRQFLFQIPLEFLVLIRVHPGLLGLQIVELVLNALDAAIQRPGDGFAQEKEKNGKKNHEVHDAEPVRAGEPPMSGIAAGCGPHGTGNTDQQG